ncbi:DUF6445 family protein [Qipengyuania sp. JC766]|uniref:DUF6445 family protein n=1 Tax=Qipengyuania sp. JC766 TaxID=3232139 RepID=UPI00345AA726
MGRDAEGRTWRIERFGREREPVVVIDGFSREADELERLGRAARYEAAQGYPGIRAPFDPRYLQLGAPLFQSLVEEAFGLSGEIMAERCDFSIVSIPPDRLQDGQRRPHYDGTEPGLLATVHFLGDERDGGTAFYEHRRSGFETVTAEREDEFARLHRRDVEEFGPPPARYHYGDDESYRMIGQIGARRDRLIAYRGRTLHSGHIPMAPDPATARTSGRLTLNCFLHAGV